MKSFNKICVGVLLLTAVSVSAQTQTKYQKVLAQIDQVVNLNPTEVQKFVLGSNNQGEPIYGLKIGHGQTNNIVVATHHGNEYGSTAVAMGFAYSLAQKPIADQTIYIIPVLNIPGYNQVNRYEYNNQQSVDPNRDYPGPCKNKSVKDFLLNSTSALAQFIDNNNIVASATLHTYWPAVLYPWGISTSDLSTPYDQTFIDLGKAATLESGYAVGNSTEMLYAADGAYEDYAFWKHGIWSLLFEMGTTHSPSDAAMKQMADVNSAGLRRFFVQAPKQRAADHDFHGTCDTRNLRLRRIFLE